MSSDSNTGGNDQLECYYCGEPIVPEDLDFEDFTRITAKYGPSIGPWTFGFVKDYWCHQRCRAENIASEWGIELPDNKDTDSDHTVSNHD